MVESFLIIVFVIFGVAGICDFLYIIAMLFNYPGYRCSSYSIVVLKKGFAIKQLNFLWQKIKWRGNDFAKGIIAITDNIEDDELLVCKDFIIGKDITLCNADLFTQCSPMVQGEL